MLHLSNNHLTDLFFEVDGDISKLSVYQKMQFNPLKDPTEFNKILSTPLSKVYEFVTNGAPFGQGHPRGNLRFWDLFQVMADGVAIYNIESKNSRKAGGNIMLKNAASDILSSIFVPLFDAISNKLVGKEVQILPQREKVSIAIDEKDTTSLKYFLTKIIGITSLSKLVSYNKFNTPSTSKGARQMQFFIEACKIINTRLDEDNLDKTVNIISELFKNNDFKEELSKLPNYHRQRLTDLELLLLYYQINPQVSWLKNILLQKDSTGKYKIVLDVLFRIYKETEIELKKQYLENFRFFILKDPSSGDFKEYSYNTIPRDFEIQTSWKVVHKITYKKDGTTRIENGLIALNDDISIDLKPFEKENDIEIRNGYYHIRRDSSGSIIETQVIDGAYISSPTGKILAGKVYLNRITKRISILSDSQIASMIIGIPLEIMKETDKYLGTDIKNVFEFTYFRSTDWNAGSKITSILQEVNSEAIPTGAHESIITGLTLTERFNKAKKKGFIINENRFNINGMKEKVRILNQFLYEISIFLQIFVWD
ncbi:MAG: hypothetical protein GF311_07350 [Candidatus Lokiarchaeota archaeon]|nr:hypothetical protein [Candidatus Lokiarchaeota archaeon]